MQTLKYVKRKMDMLFVRGDGVILVSPWAIIQSADADWFHRSRRRQEHSKLSVYQ